MRVAESLPIRELVIARSQPGRYSVQSGALQAGGHTRQLVKSLLETQLIPSEIHRQNQRHRTPNVCSEGILQLGDLVIGQRIEVGASTPTDSESWWAANSIAQADSLDTQ